MTDRHTTTGPAWDDLSDPQKVEWLARFRGLDVVSDADGGWLWYRGEKRKLTVFAPLTDWNHWRQVELKVLENDSLLYHYKWAVLREMEKTMGKDEHMTDMMMKADLPERCRALYNAYHSFRE